MRYIVVDIVQFRVFMLVTKAFDMFVNLHNWNSKFDFSALFTLLVPVHFPVKVHILESFDPVTSDF